MDGSDYPTKKTLDRIKDYDIIKEGVDGLLEILRENWSWEDRGFKLTGKRVKHLILHTSGWSGNEEIINALSKNMFWMLYWEKSIRGGHYYFTITPIKKGT